MKRNLQRFLMAAFAALLGTSAWADESWTDVTSDYIANATFTEYYSKSDNTAWPVYTTGRTGNTQHPKNWYLHTNGTTNHNVTAGTLFECWAANQAVKKWVLFQDVTLPAGRYQFTGQFSTNESRGHIQTVAITPHHTYTSEGITASNWGSWGDQTVTFNLLKETKVRVGANCENFAQIHQFILKSAGAAGLLDNLISEANTLSSTGLADAISAANTAMSGTDEEKVTAANTLSEAILTYRLAHASSASPVDMTDNVKDPSFEGMEEAKAYTGNKNDISTWTYDKPNDQGARAATGSDYLIYQNDGFYVFNIWGGSSMGISQTIESLPRGKYQITAQYASDSGKTLTLYTGSKDNGTSISSGTNKNTVVNGTSNATYVAKNGSLTIGAYSTSWYKLDGIKLSYIGYNLSDIPSDELNTTSCTAEADDWYAFTVLNAGIYKVTSSTAATIYYTQEGSTAYDATISTSKEFTANQTQELELAAGTFYVKSSAATTITLAPSSYSYVVGGATSDKVYVQPGQAVTITYSNATTDNPSASPAVSGTPKVSINDVDVEVTSADNGFSFTVPDGLTANTTYTLSIPAGVYGYADGATYNEAQEITFKTPAIFDQICYIYSPKNNKFLSRGSAYGTAAMLDDYGIPVKVVTDATNKTTVQFVDNALYMYNDNWAYTDGAASAAMKYTVENFTSTTSSFVGYKFITNVNSEGAGLYINLSEANRLAHNSADGTNCTDDDYMCFQIKTKAERDAIKDANVLTNHVAIASAAGQTVETEEAFTSYLDGLTARTRTSNVSGAALTGSLDAAWKSSNVKNNGSAYTIDTNAAEFYESSNSFTQTVTGLSQGIYKVTLNGFFREGSSDNCIAYKDYDLSDAYLKANDYQINLKAWASECDADAKTPNNRASSKKAFDEGKYLNTLYTYVGDDGNLTLTIGNPNYMTVGWVCFENLTLTYYDDSKLGGYASSLANGEYTQTATELTVTYPEAADGAAFVAGSKATVNDQDVVLEGVTNGFKIKFADAVEAGKSYVIAIPADVYGYDTEKNTTINITVNTPAVLDGTYFLMAGEKGYLATGGITSTEGILLAEGNAIKVTTDAAGISKLQVASTEKYFKTSGSTVATWMDGTDDNAKNIWTLAKSGDGITIKTATANSGKVNGYATYVASYTNPDDSKEYSDVVNIAEDAANAIVWTFEVPTTDFAALNEAISTAEAKTLGFQTGEYAPYNNVAALQALAAAKAIDQKDGIYQASVIASMAKTLSNATWTANTEEVNAVYDGTFANASNNGAPAGWTSTKGDVLGNGSDANTTHPRVFVGDDRLSEFNDTKSAFFVRYDGTYSEQGTMYYYGQTTGYTMPLKANTVYYLKFNASEWGSAGNNFQVNLIAPSSSDNKSQQIKISCRADNSEDTPATFYIPFKTSEAGDYQINLQSPGSGNNHNRVVSNFELYSLNSVSRTTATGKLGTICLPYAFTATNATIYSVEIKGSDDNMYVSLTEVDNPVAGTPYIYKATQDADAEAKQTFAYTSGDVVSKPVEALPLVGVFEATELSYGSNPYNYVLSNGKFCPVSGGAIPAYKAYLSTSYDCGYKSDGGTNAKALNIVFADDATAIKSVSNSVNNGAVYNLTGQRVAANVKGIVIVNGKKYINK